MKTHIALILLLVIGLAAPAFAADDGEVTPADLDAARRRNAEMSASLETTDIRYEAAVAEEIQIRERLHGMATRVSQTEQALAILRLTAAEVARESYMTVGSDGGVTTIFGSTSFLDIPVRATYLRAANDRDLEVIDEMLLVEDQYRSQVQELDDALSRQRDLVTEIEGLAQQLLAQLDEANAEYRELEAAWQRQEEERERREEAERQRRAAEEERERREEAAASTTTTAAPEPVSASTATTTTVASTTTTAATTTTTTTTTEVPAETATTVAVPEEGGLADTTTTTAAPTTTTSTTVPTPSAASRVCPVDGASSFSNSWGAPRSGGRTHKGVDMSASRGTPLVAMEAGGIYRLSTSSLGGISVYLIGNSGDIYYYAHLDAWADGLAGGQSVAAGDLVGYVGTTGNSPSWLPHLHLGWKPDNTDWANPYPMVNQLCR